MVYTDETKAKIVVVKMKVFVKGHVVVSLIKYARSDILKKESSLTPQMKITFDDQFLVSIAEDASIILWKIQDKEGRGLKRDKEVGWAEEILITKSDLEEKVKSSTP